MEVGAGAGCEGLGARVEVGEGVGGESLLRPRPGRGERHWKDPSHNIHLDVIWTVRCNWKSFTNVVQSPKEIIMDLLPNKLAMSPSTRGGADFIISWCRWTN